MSKEIRVNYKEAYKEYERIKELFDKEDIVYSLTGSMRRKKSTIGDIDIIIKEKSIKLEKIIKEIGDLSSINKNGDYFIITKSGIDVQLIFQENEYIYNLWTSTGSKHHVAKIKNIYKEKKIELPKKVENEQEIYQRIGMTYLKPEMRDE